MADYIVNSAAARALARAVELLRHENLPSNTGLGASGAYEHLTYAIQTLWGLLNTAGFDVGNNKPTAEAVAARPAFWLATALNWVALYVHQGASFSRSILNATFSLLPTPHTVWTLQTYYLLSPSDPTGATQIEIQMGWRHTGSQFVHWTDQVFYARTDGTTQNFTNIIVGPQTGERVLFRTRFVSATGNPLSVFVDSGEVAIA